MSKTVELRITRAVVIQDGAIAPAGSVVTVDATLAKDLLHRKRAELYAGEVEETDDADGAGSAENPGEKPAEKPAARGRNAAKA